MPPDDVLGQAQHFADSADFVFEEIAEGLDQLEAELFGQAADVVMEFDVGGGAGVAVAAFDHVGIERALREEVGVLDRLGFALEDVDELAGR